MVEDQCYFCGITLQQYYTPRENINVGKYNYIIAVIKFLEIKL